MVRAPCALWLWFGADIPHREISKIHSRVTQQKYPSG
jgi:hypothetical protein